MPERTCSVDGCDRPHYARTLCRPCYDRQRHLATNPPTEVIDGLRRSDWAKIDMESSEGGCWLWVGCVGRTEGYGRVSWQSVSYDAHRYVWLRLVGPVPDDLELDHLCRVRHCVNPEHLEPVPHRENVMRGESPTRYNAEKQACPKGHEYDRRQITKVRNKRVCGECRRVGSQARPQVGAA